MSDQNKEASDKIKVAVRVRPLIERERNNNVVLNWNVKSPNEIYQVDRNNCLVPLSQYVFDRVFSFIESNWDVYNEICKDVVNSVFNGMHGTIFAYGQTSSGKTFTMSGNEIEQGVILQAINDIFSLIETVPEREFLLRVSYMEIYNEVVSDLLVSTPTQLKIKENTNGEVFVDGLREEVVSTPENVMKFLNFGHERRHVGDTAMNEHSSRSHAIFRMIIESKLCNSGSEGAVQVSHLNLVDLAGSEKAGQMGSTGQRLAEGIHINQSLLSLGTVIKTLSEGKTAFFRNSKLTRILQNSLGGNARTAIICNVTPTAIEQTLSTILFAKRAKDICNKPKVNEVLSDQAQLRIHKRKIQVLEKELQDLKNDRAKDDVEKELQEKNRRIKDLEFLAKNLKSNVLVSSMTPKMMARKQRRETWGGHIKSLPVSGDFPPIIPRCQSQSVYGSASPPLRTPIEEDNLDIFTDVSSASNNSRTKNRSKCVTFRAQPSVFTDFSTSINSESFRESDEFHYNLRLEEESLFSAEDRLRLKLDEELLKSCEKDKSIEELTNRLDEELLKSCEKDKSIEELTNRLDEEMRKSCDKDKSIEELTNRLDEEMRILREKKKSIEELTRRLDEEMCILCEKNKSIKGLNLVNDESEKEILKLQKVLEEKDSIILQLQNQISHELLSFSTIERQIDEICESETNCKIQELEYHISNLQTELEKSSKHQEGLNTEIKEMRLRLVEFEELEKNFLKKENQNAKLRREIDQFQSLVNELRSQNDNQKETDKYNSTVNSLKLELELALKNYREIKDSYTILSSETDEYKRRINDLNSKLENETKVRNDLEEESSDLKFDKDLFESIKQLDENRELEDLRVKLSLEMESKSEEHRQCIDKLEKMICEIRTERDSYEKRSLEMELKVREYQESIAASTSKLENETKEVDDEKARLRTEMDKQRSQIDELQNGFELAIKKKQTMEDLYAKLSLEMEFKSNEHQKYIDETENMICEQRNEIDSYTKLSSEMKIKVQEQQESIDALTSKLENKIKEVDDEKARLGTDIDKQKSQSNVLQNELEMAIKKNREMEDFSEKLSLELESKSSEHQKCIDELEKVISELTLERDSYSKIILEMEIKVHKCQETITALTSKLENKIKEGDYENGRLRLEMDHQISQIDVLQNELELAIKNKREVEDICEKLSLEIEFKSIEHQKYINELEKVNSELRNELDSYAKLDSGTEYKITEYQKSIDELTSKLENEIQRQNELKFELNSCLKYSSKMEIMVKDNQNSIDDLTSQLETKAAACKELEKVILELRSNLENSEKALIETKDKLVYAGKRESDLLEQGKNCTNQITDLVFKLDEVANSKNELESKIDSIKAELEAYELRVKILMEEKCQVERVSSDLKSTIEELKIHDMKHSHQNSIDDLTSELKNKATHCKELEKLILELTSKLKISEKAHVETKDKLVDTEKRASALELEVEEGKICANQIIDLVIKLDEVTTIKNELESKINNMKAELEAYELRVKILMEEKCQVERVSSELKSTIEELKTHDTEHSHQNSIDDLTSKLENKATHCKELEMVILELTSKLEIGEKSLLETKDKLVDAEKRKSDLELKVEEGKICTNQNLDLVIKLDEVTKIKNELESRIDNMKGELEAYELRVEILMEEKCQVERVSSELKSTIEELKTQNTEHSHATLANVNDDNMKKEKSTPVLHSESKMKPICCLDKETKLIKALEDVSAQDTIINELKHDLEEEKLKFEEYFEDITEEQLRDSEVMLKQREVMLKQSEEINNLTENINSLNQQLQDLLSQNQSLTKKILNINVDENQAKEVKSLIEKLSEERTKRYETDIKLTNEIKRCESLKNEAKHYNDKIYNLTNQLRKLQNSLNETIIPTKTNMQSPEKKVSQGSSAVSNLNVTPSVEILGNIGSMQVIEAQRQLYQLQKHCEKVEKENQLLRQKYKQLKKRYSTEEKDESEIISFKTSINDKDTLTTSNPVKNSKVLIESSDSLQKNLEGCAKSLNPLPSEKAPSIKGLMSLDCQPKTPTGKYNTVADYSDFTLTLQPNEDQSKSRPNECGTQ